MPPPEQTEISVIMPVHNGERYLEEAICSVLGQTFSALETIVVDDGSTDRTGVVAQKFVGPKLRLVGRPHGGLSAALNTGLSVAIGAYFSFLDADDLWEPDKLELQMIALETSHDLEMVFGRVVQFVSPELGASPRPEAVSSERTEPGYFAGTMLIRRASFFRVGLFDAGWRVGQFVDWYARAVEMGLRGTMLPHVLMRRRIHRDNMGIREKVAQVDYTRVLRAALERRRKTAVGPDELGASKK